MKKVTMILTEEKINEIRRLQNKQRDLYSKIDELLNDEQKDWDRQNKMKILYEMKKELEFELFHIYDLHMQIDLLETEDC